jgi:hypothetical protein
MLDRLNSVSVAAAMPYFVTATLPDDTFDDNVARFARSAKGWLDTFTKRLLRVCPTAAGFWRIEWKARKSGLHVGKLFPHFHLMVWGLAERKISEETFYYDKHGEPVFVPEKFEAFVECKDDQLTLDFVRVASSGAAKVADADCDVRSWTEHNGEKFMFAGSRR